MIKPSENHGAHSIVINTTEAVADAIEYELGTGPVKQFCFVERDGEGNAQLGMDVMPEDWHAVFKVVAVNMPQEV